MDELKNMELLTRMYKVKTVQETTTFDWMFVLPITEELDKIKRKYFLIYSHYNNDERKETPALNYLRFRIIGHPKVIESFKKIEGEYINKLGYDIDDDEFSYDIIKKKYNIKEKEMIELFEFWDKAARFKMELIKSRNRNFDTHYALNTLGFVRTITVPIDFPYPEEQVFVDRNFPKPDNIKNK